MTTPPDTRTLDELRAAVRRGEPVTPADIRAARAREEARLDSVLAARREARENYDDPRGGAEERAAARRAALDERDQTAPERTAGVDAMRRARQDRHTPGGPALRPTDNARS